MRISDWSSDVCSSDLLDFSNRARGSASALEEELVQRMRAAVRSRMVADVPLGAFLSGGVDSSAVVALMAEASTRAVKTCTIGFAEAGHDERRFAKIGKESCRERVCTYV